MSPEVEAQLVDSTIILDEGVRETPPEAVLVPPAEDIREALEPAGYKLLVYIMRKEERTRTGVWIPEERRFLEEIAAPRAQVISLGALAYKDPKRFPDGKAWCRPGDVILMRPYAGTRFVRVIEGVPSERWPEYRLINDDSVEGVIHCNPEEIMRPEAV
ncbi:MAG TPA: hypothetical protein VH157_06985 [Bryobacteraceae bacterium]|jgi:co-chaperonin GroES (HSP10)|nr:hypothetical protein [Bryobacteraceae bacterium]